MNDMLVFISGIIAAFVAIRTALYAIRSKNINEERIKWRDEVRKLSLDLVDKKNKNKDLTAISLCSRLNPIKDINIIKLATGLAKRSNDSNEELFLLSINHMLKHDWERCKNDTDFLGFLKTVKPAYYFKDKASIDKFNEEKEYDYYSPHFDKRKILLFIFKAIVSAALLFILYYVIHLLFDGDSNIEIKNIIIIPPQALI